MMKARSLTAAPRLKACRRAGVPKPQFQKLNGIDPVAFIFSSNDKRRHMTKGQRAMIAPKVRNYSAAASNRSWQNRLVLIPDTSTVALFRALGEAKRARAIQTAAAH
jgi:hypothetical protein